MYILRELSKSFPQLWVRVADSDGEFLLIEAAAVLPQWISPEIDQHRVWIHQGKLWLIPAPLSDSEKGVSCAGQLTLRDAIECLRRKATDLVHSPLVEAEAFYRLQKYPDFIEASLHYSTIAIPRKLAYVLHTFPRSIAMAVEAFYLRDALSLRPIMAGSDSLTFYPEDMVLMSVQFSKVLFAQLKSQRFQSPPIWQHLSENPPEALTAASNKAALTRQIEMGMKLTCGFEMLSRKASESKHRVVREMDILLKDQAEDGDHVLPTNEEMRAWPDYRRDDAENWMDIDYEDFERELLGQRAHGTVKEHSGFGSAQTQTDLRKIVSRFEAFLNDDKAGLDGADLDEARSSDEDDETEDSEFEDKIVSFDDEAFAQMMREMMGLPGQPQSTKATVTERGEPSSAGGQEDDSGELQELALQFETELKQHGALDLEANLDKNRERLAGATHTKEQVEGTANDPEGEVDVDYNLAMNILESFKGQAGLAGPASNLLGMMGITLPRDEDDKEDDP